MSDRRSESWFILCECNFDQLQYVPIVFLLKIFDGSLLFQLYISCFWCNIYPIFLFASVALFQYGLYDLLEDPYEENNLYDTTGDPVLMDVKVILSTAFHTLGFFWSLTATWFHSYLSVYISTDATLLSTLRLRKQFSNWYVGIAWGTSNGINCVEESGKLHCSLCGRKWVNESLHDSD